MSGEATFGIVFEIAIFILDQLHIHNPVIIWSLYLLGMGLLIDFAGRGGWAKNIEPRQKRKRIRFAVGAGIVFALLIFGYWMFVRLHETKSAKASSPQSPTTSNSVQGSGNTAGNTSQPGNDNQSQTGNNNTQIRGDHNTVINAPKNPPKPQPQQKIEQGPGSALSIGQTGGTIIGTVNLGPPPLKLDYSLRELSRDEKGTFEFNRNKCPFAMHLRIVPNQSVPPPIRVALDFDKPVKEIATTIENVGAITGGGPFTVGLHAVSSPISPGIGPDNALIVEVCSDSPVKLVGGPHLVN